MLTAQEFVSSSLLKLTDYIDGITTGNIISNRYEKLAVERFIKFKSKYSYKEKELIKVLRFFSLLNIANGNKIEQINLLPHQIFWLANFYALYTVNENRLFTTAYIETAKKSGKSSFSSCLSIYESIGAGVLNAHSLILASSREQARTNLSFCQSIIENSPLIEPLFKINKNIIFNRTDTTTNKIEIRASEAGKLHGIGNGMSLSIIDEYAFHKNSDLKNAVKTAQIVMPSHLQLIFTTASNNLQSPAYSLRQTCCNILDNQIEDDSIFTQIFTLDDKSEVNNPEMWRKANPSIGYIISKEQMIKEYNSAKVFPDKLNSFLIFNLNVWVQNLATNWIEDDLIKEAMKGEPLIPEGSKVYVGYDGSAVRDLTAIGLLFHDERTDTFIAKTINVFPDNPTKKIRQGSIDLSQWIEQGYIIQNPATVIDDEFITNIFSGLKEQYNIVSIGYDAFNSMGLFQKIERELDIECNIVRQNITTMNYPTRILEILVHQGKIKFEKSPVLRWNFQNVRTYYDSNNNVKLQKNKGESIDGIISIVNAIHQYLAMNESSTAYFLQDMQTLYANKEKA